MIDVITIIPAAGSGERMRAGKNKAFLKIDGESVIKRTLTAFLLVESVKEIYIMVNPLEKDEMLEHISDLENPYQTKIQVVVGGETRQDSVRMGLEYVANHRKNSINLPDISQNLYENIKSSYHLDTKRTLCLIHDGARCLIKPKFIEEYILTLINDPVGLGVAIPLSDTIRKIDPEGNVVETPDRSSYRAMQTPQGSDFEVLLVAHQFAKENGIQVTDDIAVLEAINYPVKLYPGETTNIKITHPEDIPIAEKLLKIE